MRNDKLSADHCYGKPFYSVTPFGNNISFLLELFLLSIQKQKHYRGISEG